MALPININALVHGQAVEWERVEFKEGWNPEEAIQAICAFANDFHNWGGGYLVLGVKTDNGKPLLPPLGLQPEQADAWQRKLLELCFRLQPAYHPISEVGMVDGKLVLVVWVPGGEMRPYKAPVSLRPNNCEFAYFVRLHANTVRAKGELEQELVSLANRIPFDDRQNSAAQVSELQPSLMQSFLAEIRSGLQSEAPRLSLDELGRHMQIVRGPPEAPRPLNVGLLFFTLDPTRWFPQTQIDTDENRSSFLVRFPLRLAPAGAMLPVTPEVTRLLPLCVTPLTRRELQQALALRDDEHFRTAYLLPALEKGLIERTIPAKPTSRLQRYRLTPSGRQWLESTPPTRPPTS